MATISSLSGAQSAAQSGLQQLRLQQAKRDAERAEFAARVLLAQARDAQQKASDAQETARSITTQSDQAQTQAGQARQGLAVIKSINQMGAQVSSVVTQVAEKLKLAKPAAKVQDAAAPVINTQGQVTGTVINTTA